MYPSLHQVFLSADHNYYDLQNLTKNRLKNKGNEHFLNSKVNEFHKHNL